MYRKSVDYGQQSAIQIVQFASLRRKSEQPPELIVENASNCQFRIKKLTNTLPLVMLIADILTGPGPRGKKEHVFHDFVIDNVPKNYQAYQHESTLEQLLYCITYRSKDLATIQDLIVNYSITEFVLNCLARRIIKSYLDANRGKGCQLNYYGNQEQLLIDYSTELRGQLLHALALCLQLSVTVAYRDAGSHLEDTFREYYGDRDSPHKIQINDVGQFYLVSMSRGGEETKLLSINSSHNIIYTEARGKKEAESLNTTMEGQSVRMDSRSAHKDVKCLKCKGNCECERSTRKAVISRQLTTNLPTRSIFDSIGLGTAPKRQTSTHEISATKR